MYCRRHRRYLSSCDPNNDFICSKPFTCTDLIEIEYNARDLYLRYLHMVNVKTTFFLQLTHTSYKILDLWFLIRDFPFRKSSWNRFYFRVSIVSNESLIESTKPGKVYSRFSFLFESFSRFFYCRQALPSPSSFSLLQLQFSHQYRKFYVLRTRWKTWIALWLSSALCF